MKHSRTRARTTLAAGVALATLAAGGVASANDFTGLASTSPSASAPFLSAEAGNYIAAYEYLPGGVVIGSSVQLDLRSAAGTTQCSAPVDLGSPASGTAIRLSVPAVASGGFAFVSAATGAGGAIEVWHRKRTNSTAATCDASAWTSANPWFSFVPPTGVVFASAPAAITVGNATYVFVLGKPSSNPSATSGTIYLTIGDSNGNFSAWGALSNTNYTYPDGAPSVATDGTSVFVASPEATTNGFADLWRLTILGGGGLSEAASNYVFVAPDSDNTLSSSCALASYNATQLELLCRAHDPSPTPSDLYGVAWVAKSLLANAASPRFAAGTPTSVTGAPAFTPVVSGSHLAIAGQLSTAFLRPNHELVWQASETLAAAPPSSNPFSSWSNTYSLY